MKKINNKNIKKSLTIYFNNDKLILVFEKRQKYLIT